MRSKIIFLFLFLAFSFINFSCHKNKVQEQLPSETQTGAGTIGFSVNGKIYQTNYPKAHATYLHLSPPFVSGYFLTVSANVNSADWYIGILSDSLQIQEGISYPLNNNIDSPGKCAAVFSNLINEFRTRSNLQGELKISKLDNVHQIVSGTFWFDALDTVSNTTVQVREGRFDLHYTQ